MLRSLKDLEHYTIAATDGDVGSVTNFLVDDERWTIRYLVAKTGNFFAGRSVLISPLAFRQADWATRTFHVQLTIEKVKLAPSIDVDQSVSRRHEMELARYYRYPSYWGYAGIWGMSASPASLAAGSWSEPATDSTVVPADIHLRSMNEICGYHVQGSDDGVGRIQDFIVDDESWEVRYLVIDTSNWLAGKRVLISPHWVTGVSWEERKVHLRKSRETMRNSPAWNADEPINRDYESRLYAYYGRPSYWPDPSLPTITGAVEPTSGPPRG